MAALVVRCARPAAMSSNTSSPPELRRVLGPAATTVYAAGDILGAGIYALVGTVVALSHSGAWLSFVLAAVLALLTGLTYAELSSRIPLAAGAAAYSRRAFAHPAVAFLVGVVVLASGLTSAATIAHAMVGYLDTFATFPSLPTSLALLCLMACLNFVGIEESSRVNIVLTAVEFSGLLLVIAVGVLAVRHLEAEVVATRLTDSTGLEGVIAGATVAFYAYIGFEDTANIAEEVHDPTRVVPRAILTAIVVTTFLYVVVTILALLVVPQEKLAGSARPLLAIFEESGVAFPSSLFSVIALLAIGNTGLLNLIMASRLTYGMAREGLFPSMLARVHPRRRTPWVAIVATLLATIALVVSGGVRILAQTTSLLLLSVFTVLHIAVLRLKRQRPDPGPDVFQTPAWTPVLGALACAAMIFQFPREAYARTAVVVTVGLTLYVAFAARAARRVP
jgi:amino acid transporter